MEPKTQNWNSWLIKEVREAGPKTTKHRLKSQPVFARDVAPACRLGRGGFETRPYQLSPLLSRGEERFSVLVKSEYRGQVLDFAAEDRSIYGLHYSTVRRTVLTTGCKSRDKN